MRVLHVSLLRSSFDLTGTACFGLCRRLAEIRGVAVTHAAIASPATFKTLLARRRMLRVGGSYMQADAMVNVLPVPLPDLPEPEAAECPRFLRSVDRQLTSFLPEWRPDVVHVWGTGQKWQRLALRLAGERGSATALTYDSPSATDGRRRALVRLTADMADAVLATSDRAASELAPGKPGWKGPLLDGDFWSPSRIMSSDLHFWNKVLALGQGGDLLITCVIERPQRAFLDYVFTSVRQVTHAAGNRGIRLVVINDSRANSERERAQLDHCATAAGIRELLTIMGTQPKALIRSLYQMSHAVVLGPSCTSARWSVLEALRLGCVPFAPAGTALAEPVRHGSNGFIYEPGRAMDLTGPLLDSIRSPQLRTRVVAQGKKDTDWLTGTNQAEDCLRIYRDIAGPGAQTPGVGKSGTRVNPKGDRDWVRNTVLALDLDLTILRPSPGCEPRPTPFPLQSTGNVHLTCDIGPAYVVRSGLDALERILRLPWKARLVCSMADQDKVNEVTRAVTIGTRKLADWMDASVGNEILDAFAAARGIDLGYRSERCLNNPHGRTVKCKPSGFFQLKQLRALGNALSAGDRDTALRIAARGALRKCRALVIDDSPYLEPASPDVICYRVPPFLDIEDYELICRKTDLNTPLVFNFLDHLWRASSFPFHFLAHLLERRPRWKQFSQRLNTEFEITEAVRHAGTFRQFRWMRTCASGAVSYARYLRTRRAADAGLDLARYREHAKIYRTLAQDYIEDDVWRGWSVLLLGRDMDYAYQVFADMYPQRVAARKVAILPLSRASMQRILDEDLVRIVCDYLPDLDGPSNRGLRIYDVGFHGQVPSHIAGAMGRFAWTFAKAVEVALLNACSCPGKPTTKCVGEALRFNSRQGPFTISRNFGISIERCPHRTGPLEQVTRQATGAVFQFSRQVALETARALELRSFMNAQALHVRDRLPRELDPVSRVVHQAFHTLQSTASQVMRQLRRTAEKLFLLSQLPETNKVRLAVFPFFGADLLTPLVCFSRLDRIILLDCFQASLDWHDCDFATDSTYLAQLTIALGTDFAHPAARLARIRDVWYQRPASMEEAHGRALVSVPSLLSLARLLPGVERQAGGIKVRDASGGSKLSWSMAFEDGRNVDFEYLRCTGDLGNPALRATVRRELQSAQSALILRGLPVLPAAAAVCLREWSQVAGAILYDNTAPHAWMRDGTPGIAGRPNAAHSRSQPAIANVSSVRDPSGEGYKLYLQTFFQNGHSARIRNNGP
jgi:hypothetical protein